MKTNTDKPETKTAPTPGSKDDLKSLSMPDLQEKLGSSPDGLSSNRGAETTDPIWFE